MGRAGHTHGLLMGPLNNQQREMDMNWQVYIILCSDDSLYTGITTNVERRYAQHCNGTGAKYFRGRSPQRIVYLEGGHDRSSAGRREIQIKRMRLEDKRRLVAASECCPKGGFGQPILREL